MFKNISVRFWIQSSKGHNTRESVYDLSQTHLQSTNTEERRVDWAAGGHWSRKWTLIQLSGEPPTQGRCSRRAILQILHFIWKYLDVPLLLNIVCISEKKFNHSKAPGLFCSLLQTCGFNKNALISQTLKDSISLRSLVLKVHSWRFCPMDWG